MNDFEKIQSEYQSYKVASTGHPLEALRKIKSLPKITTFAAKRRPNKTFLTTSGLLLVRQKPPTANGVCFSVIEDEYGFLDLVLFKDIFEKLSPVFLHHSFVKVSGIIERDGHSISLIVKNMSPLWNDTSELEIEPTQYFY